MPVKGKVTLGGQPLEGAVVMFTPKSGSPSAGRTNSSGEYELVFSRDYKGAEMGEHIVTISTFQEASPDAETPTPEVPEKVPFKYREGAEPLKAEVKSGDNVIDFTLEPGPVNPPQQKGGTKVRRGRNACY